MTMLKTTSLPQESIATAVNNTGFLYRAQQFFTAPFQSYQYQVSSSGNTMIVEEEDGDVLVDEDCTTPKPMMMKYNGNCQIQQQQQQQQQQQNNDLYVNASAAYRPKSGYNKLKGESQEKQGRKDCGEDAFFISTSFSTQPTTTMNEKVCAIGVADGVGGYSNMGVDPSMMAWALMEQSQSALDENPTITPYEALICAYEKIRGENLVECGGSTACVLLMTRGKDDAGNHVLKLQSSNLGDSAFMVIRDGKVIYRSVEQTHFWNCPLQMCVPPKHVADVFQDHPREANTLPTPFDLRPGDVIVAATDGLTDNVFDEKIAEIVAMHTADVELGVDITNIIAKDILDFAVQQATSRTSYTPFQKYAQENRYLYKGGKQDDISLVVARISERS
jgi:protein phosphatase PTC7